ncbi:uncharacterized protein EI90DRAFT_3011083 [Cantharellus anzutake]|uniref:uncharacterized protein n=1 Tax=Cantharellus anzutake TaxID=1750568 RepID=UPI001904562A|nr:uncharacterized protein EI90DRAFT_3011083 [Cantharellus anzutake]KAF8344357.1 hypothetical protein EI90DRAFT_3011083 [Cantharellus anzutake]
MEGGGKRVGAQGPRVEALHSAWKKIQPESLEMASPSDPHRNLRTLPGGITESQNYAATLDLGTVEEEGPLQLVGMSDSLRMNDVSKPAPSPPNQVLQHEIFRVDSEGPEAFGITYMVNIGGKYKYCRMPSTKEYREWCAAIVEVSGFSETRTFKHEFTWKMYSAPKNQDPVAVDNKTDYEMMISDVTEKVKGKKEPSVAILISNLPPKDEIPHGKQKSKKAKLKSYKPDSSSPSNSDNDSEPKQCKIPKLPVRDIEEKLRQMNDFCKSHKSHCCVLSTPGYVGKHVILNKSAVKRWAQSVDNGIASFEEPPMYLVRESVADAEVPPPPGGKKNDGKTKSTSQPALPPQTLPSPVNGGPEMVLMPNAPLQSGPIPVGPSMWPTMYTAYPPPYHYPFPFPDPRTAFLPHHYPFPGGYSADSHSHTYGDYHWQTGLSQLAPQSSEDLTPPPSAFPTVERWLDKLEDDSDFNPDGLLFSQYLVEINDLGYLHIGELSRACLSDGLHGLGVNIPHGLSEKLCHAMHHKIWRIS